MKEKRKKLKILNFDLSDTLFDDLKTSCQFRRTYL